MTTRRVPPRPRSRGRRRRGGGSNAFDVLIAMIDAVIALLTLGFLSVQEARRGRGQPQQKQGLPTRRRPSSRGRGGGAGGGGGGGSPRRDGAGDDPQPEEKRQPIYDPYDPDAEPEDAEIMDPVDDEDVIVEPMDDDDIVDGDVLPQGEIEGGGSDD